MLKSKIVSSLEKAFIDDNMDKFGALEKISVLQGERLSLQLLHTYEYTEDCPINDRDVAYAKISAEGTLAGNLSFREVGNIPIERPTLERSLGDDDYIKKTPGLYPDVLRSIRANGTVCCTPHILMSVWIEINVPTDMVAGEHELKIKLDAEGRGACEATVTVEVIDAKLPDEDIYLTQWFHCDSLAEYYGVEVFSEKHWQIIENFMKTAVKNGINLILTPTFTPPLDTAPGGERLTVQLVGVSKENGAYSFDFSLLDRWVDICDRVGVKYFEIAHLFTQWGASHAPKVMATVDGEYKKIFGWETDAVGNEYREFIRLFLTEFLNHMKKNGNDKRCFFHISDEPNFTQIENYRAAKNVVADILEGYPIMDAMSNYDFWELGLMNTPVPSNDHIEPFIENNVPNLWTYYCCGQLKRVSNRFIAMSSARNRSIGFQMYKYGIVGFLQWGYNFYYDRLAITRLNPFMQADGGGWVSPGDAFSVYPGFDGEALESMRIVVFHEALQDIKAMKLLEKLTDKETVVKLIDEAIGEPVTFKTCAKTSEQILSLREKINQKIKDSLH